MKSVPHTQTSCSRDAARGSFSAFGGLGSLGAVWTVWGKIEVSGFSLNSDIRISPESFKDDLG